MRAPDTRTLVNAFNEDYRYGSADFASDADMRRAGLLKPKGPMLGYSGQQALHIDGDAPIITIAGAGGGKGTDVLAYNVCGVRGPDGHWAAPPRSLWFEPRGELCAISLHNHIRCHKHAYVFNPFGLHGLPQHRTNPLDMLRPDSPMLHADVKVQAASLITMSGSANGEYFELRGRQWSEALLLSEVETKGGITLPRFYDLINDIQDPRVWPDIAESMLNSPTAEVRRTAIEMHTRREDAPKEFGAIMGEIIKSLSFLSDPLIRQALGGSDFSMEVLCQRDCSVFINVPAEYAQQLAPMNRLLIGAAMLYKFRHPEAPRVLFVIDEAATLGRFDLLLTGYSYGRGMGVRMWSFWQDIGQITRNFGPGALSSFLGSSQTRQFFGIRDLETAKLVSEMIGMQTLRFDPEVWQADARRDILQASRQLLNGADPFAIGLQTRQLAMRSVSQEKQVRALMTPDEILGMPENRQIIFISGMNTKPLYVNKYRYYTRPEMAGGYMPNPYHPPGDRVRLSDGYGGGRWGKVITERVPGRYASLPQYQSGQWSYIAGYRPA